ncbi:hypothetical protein [Kribbella sp. VKM Ac-2568]|uniref:hypothetical protein n=1 Tax=Kribbella sp. VKM Ac-2568 TaxID=2512219 RepID=UPI001048E1F9|nr:hypothetical protein [Kribbella sp. VKM Ac-2568]
MRAGETDVLLEGHSLAPVLQQAGQALLRAGSAADRDLIRRCVAGLRDRDAAGDDVLAVEVLAEFGEPVTSEHLSWPLTAVPVDLEMLAGFLDGDSLQGDGAVDLFTGNVYPPGSLDWDRPEEPDEDSETFDPDRWLYFQPESGEAYRDMLDFAAGLADGPLREQLFSALEGRGPFRQFRNVLKADDQLTRWTLFRDERQLGRARAWLARAGYRAVWQTDGNPIGAVTPTRPAD